MRTDAGGRGEVPAPVVVPAPGVRLHPVDGGGLLFDSRRQQLHAPDAASTLLWCAVQGGVPIDAVRRAYGEARRLSPLQATAEADEAIAGWQRHGLVVTVRDGSECPSLPGGCLPGKPAAADEREPAILPVSRRWPGPIATRAYYRILDTIFEVGFSVPELRRHVDPPLRQFAVPPAGATIEVAVATEDEGFAVAVAGRVTEYCPTLAALAPTVTGRLVTTALDRLGGVLALRAGMLRRNARCLLLPPPGANGRGCLGPALARSGFAYHSDALALLLAEPLQARGVPVAPCVPKADWTAARAFYPEIDAVPACRCGDGTVVKFLPPPTAAGDTALDRCWTVGWLVFPHFADGESASLLPLSRITALQRLLQHCVAQPRPLDHATVARLALWIDGITCADLRFAALPEAVTVVDAFCRTADADGRQSI
jgi:hypothetical protein